MKYINNKNYLNKLLVLLHSMSGYTYNNHQIAPPRVV